MPDLDIKGLPQPLVLGVAVVIQDDLLVKRGELNHQSLILTIRNRRNGALTTTPRSPKELPDLLKTRDERVDFSEGVVEVERRTRGRGHLVAQAGWARAVVSDADCDTQLVEYLADIVRMDALHRERDRAAPVDRPYRSDNPKPGHRREAVECISGQRYFVGPDLVHVDGGKIVHRGAKADRLEIGRASCRE